jgi:DNA gyrase subunit B/topoisomerase-4 subunit B
VHYVLSARILDPQFQGQVKEKLTSRDALKLIVQVIKDPLEVWLNAHVDYGKRIADLAIAQALTRMKSAQKVEKKRGSGVAVLPGKLTDCESDDVSRREVFLVEGDSAGGSAKLARDKQYQAILPLRGKVLNTESASLAKVLENKELSDLVTALGCGLGKSFELARLRYGRVIILSDADSDGHHIATLLLTFIYRHMPGLIASGRVFLAQPPLYRVDVGKETFWALDDAHRDRILKLHGNGRANPEITRFKGLGEMMPKVLWETTMNPRTRRLLRVEILDQITTDRVINELMGKDPGARFRFIMDRAEEAEELDV